MLKPVPDGRHQTDAATSTAASRRPLVVISDSSDDEELTSDQPKIKSSTAAHLVRPRVVLLGPDDDRVHGFRLLSYDDAIPLPVTPTNSPTTRSKQLPSTVPAIPAKPSAPAKARFTPTVSTPKKVKYYCVTIGRCTGVFTCWQVVVCRFRQTRITK